MIPILTRVKIVDPISEFYELDGRVVAVSITGEAVVELVGRAHQCVHVPEESLKVIGGARESAVVVGGESSSGLWGKLARIIK